MFVELRVCVNYMFGQSNLLSRPPVVETCCVHPFPAFAMFEIRRAVDLGDGDMHCTCFVDFPQEINFDNC